MRKSILLMATALMLPLAPMAAAQPTAAANEAASGQMARDVAAGLVPDGAMENAFKGLSETMSNGLADTMINSMGQVSVADILKPYNLNLSDEKLAVLKKVPLREMILATDPQFSERMNIMMKIMFDRMGPLARSMEPAIRSGLAQSLGKQFSAAELRDLAAFLRTPAGKRFGAQWISLYSSPEVMGATMKMMPEFTGKLPEIMAEVEEQMKALPDPKADPAGINQRIDALIKKYGGQ